jgi:hypothetical protein
MIGKKEEWMRRADNYLSQKGVATVQSAAEVVQFATSMLTHVSSRSDDKNPRDRDGRRTTHA